jgi:hypothetical protein
MKANAKTERHLRFADTFVSLWRREKMAGIDRPRVGRQAAQLVGYGAKSWCLTRALQAADTMQRLLLKKPVVIDRIKTHGLVRDGREFRELQ